METLLIILVVINSLLIIAVLVMRKLKKELQEQLENKERVIAELMKNIDYQS
ncbi:MAG: hypothetical protein RBR97_12235 [Bacteroidales bacterium]|nr:hypothetical protein [Bacteroidales bacterium]